MPAFVQASICSVATPSCRNSSLRVFRFSGSRPQSRLCSAMDPNFAQQVFSLVILRAQQQRFPFEFGALLVEVAKHHVWLHNKNY
jgi:hypothetical protein